MALFGARNGFIFFFAFALLPWSPSGGQGSSARCRFSFRKRTKRSPIFFCVRRDGKHADQAARGGLVLFLRFVAPLVPFGGPGEQRAVTVFRILKGQNARRFFFWSGGTLNTQTRLGMAQSWRLRRGQQASGGTVNTQSRLGMAQSWRLRRGQQLDCLFFFVPSRLGMT